MATRTFVSGGATKNWSDTTAWVEGIVPTAADDVVFTAGNGTLTIDGTSGSPSLCRSLDATGFTGTLGQASAKYLTVGDGTVGHFKLVAGMTYAPNTAAFLNFVSTATGNQITTAAKVLCSVVFNGSGDWQLQDNILLYNGGTITLTAGTIKFNGKNVGGASNGNFLSSNNSNARGLDFTGGTTTWTTGNSAATFWDITTSTNMTITNASNLVITQGNNSSNGTFSGGGLTYGTLQNTVLTSGTLTINGANTFSTLTLSSGAGQGGYHALGANQTVSGTFTANGNSISNQRVFIRSTVRGTSRTISAATVTVTNADFQDITGAGAGSWNLSAISGGSGDCGGNSGITFTTPRNCYVKTGASANMNSATLYFTTSGGSTQITPSFPLPQDTIYVDANSITAGSVTLTNNNMMMRMPKIDWTGVTNTPTWAKTTACEFYGSIIMSNSMSQSGTANYTYAGRGSSTLTGGSTTWTNALVIDCVNGSGTLTLGGNFSSSSTLTGTSGTFAGASTYTTSFTTCTWNGGTYTETAAMTLTGAFAVAGGTFGAGVSTVTGNTTSANTGGTINLLGILGSTTHNYSAGTTTVGASGLTGTTFTNSGGSFTLNGASTGMTGNMTLSGGTVTLNANYTTTGTLSISNDMTLNVANATLNTSTINIVGSGTGGGLAANPMKGFIS